MRPGLRMTAALVAVALGAYGWPAEAREDDGDVPVPRVIGTRPKAVDVPGKRPFVGPPGEDPFGYPVRTADRAALSQLLRLRRFDELDRYLSEYQADFERDPKKEYWAIDAFDSFDTEDPDVGLALDQWIEARPSSWTARMARGTYRLALAWFQRGNKTAAKTSRARFRAMDETLRSAHADLLKALEAKPTLVAAQRKLIIMGRLGSQYRAEEPQVLAVALKNCPACFQVRVAFMFGLVPRWGGTYVAMTDFARETQKQAELNPRLRVLEGYVDHDRCNEAILDKEWNKAGKICRRLARYEHWELDLELAKVLLHEKKHEEAIVLLDRALLQRPQDDELLRYRMYVLDGLERWEDLGGTALTLRRLNVADERIAKMAANAADRLVYEAYRLGQAKEFKRARALLDLTLAIDPEHGGATGARASLPAFEAAMRPKPRLDMPTDEQQAIDELKQAVADDPDDFQARMDLDAALFRFNRFKEIVASWDDYIRRHPDDGRALLERAGTYSHLRDADKALADLDGACELGVKEACKRAAFLKQRLRR